MVLFSCCFNISPAAVLLSAVNDNALIVTLNSSPHFSLRLSLSGVFYSRHIFHFYTHCAFLFSTFSFPTLIFFILLSVSLLSILLPFIPAVDQSGSVGSGQPLVNAVRSDSALIGGTELFHCFSPYFYPFFCACIELF